MNDLTPILKTNPTVLVMFYATWCPHCQRMQPIVDDISVKYADKLKVFKFDIDENEVLAKQNNVQAVPTFILYKNGTEMWRNSGEMTSQALLSHITPAF